MSFTEEVLPALVRIKDRIPDLEVGSPWSGGVYVRYNLTYLFATHDQRENDINFSASHGYENLHEATLKKASIYVLLEPEWLERKGVTQLIQSSRRRSQPVSFQHVATILEIMLDNRERIAQNYDAMVALDLPERGRVFDGKHRYPWWQD